MRRNSKRPKAMLVRVANDIGRAPRRSLSTEDKTRTLLEGLRGQYSVAVLCRREEIAESPWSAQLIR
jgi:transposase